MNPKQYFRDTARTWNKSESFKAQVDNATHGIIGEVGEFIENSNDIEEAGDVWYYLATFMRLCGEKPRVIAPENLTPKMVSTQQMLKLLPKLAESVKKWVHHEKPKHKPEAVKIALEIASVMTAICTYREWDVREVWALNIEKLRQRWPEGFVAGADTSD